jgi:hypothetical protein
MLRRARQVERANAAMNFVGSPSGRMSKRKFRRTAEFSFAMFEERLRLRGPSKPFSCFS